MPRIPREQRPDAGVVESVLLFAIDPLMALAPGTRLGPYDILAPIGGGVRGEGYRARDQRLGRKVAVKVLPRETVTGDRLQRFLREARAASQLNPPNVVAIHDIGESEG